MKSRPFTWPAWRLHGSCIGADFSGPAQAGTGRGGTRGDAVTFSVVARDPDTGALGVAMATCMFASGALVPWARPGVGAVATQAIAESAYGPRCLDALQAGASAPSALSQAQASDPAVALRQVGVVSADGGVAAMTGELCVDHAGHLLGDGYAVQANMMASPRVWPAMEAAFSAAAGPFSRRLLTALEAGQAAGGDARGEMSAALLVVAGQTREPWARPVVDLRVDRSHDPLGELGRLVDAAEAYDGFSLAADALVQGDAGAALVHVDRALARLPGEESLRFLRAGALLAGGDVDGGRSELRALVAGRPTWEIVIRSFAAKGLISVPASVSLDALLDRAAQAG
jgi:uncharacterized Ntn-hydrolase superfamily protein